MSNSHFHFNQIHSDTVNKDEEKDLHRPEDGEAQLNSSDEAAALAVKKFQIHYDFVSEDLAKNLSRTEDGEVPFYLSDEVVALIAANNLKSKDSELFFAKNLYDFAIMLTYFKLAASHVDSIHCSFLIKEEGHYQFVHLHIANNEIIAIVLDSVFTLFQDETIKWVKKIFPGASIFATNFTLQRDTYSCSIFSLDWAARFKKLGAEKIIEYFKSRDFTPDKENIIYLTEEDMPFELIKLTHFKRDKLEKLFTKIIQKNQFINVKKYQNTNSSLFLEENIDHNSQKNVLSFFKEKKFRKSFLVPILESNNKENLYAQVKKIQAINLLNNKTFISEQMIARFLSAVDLSLNIQNYLPNKDKIKISIPAFHDSKCPNVFLDHKNRCFFQKDIMDVFFDYGTMQNPASISGPYEKVGNFIQLLMIEAEKTSHLTIILEIIIYKIMFEMAKYIPAEKYNAIFSGHEIVKENNNVYLCNKEAVKKELSTLNGYDAISYINHYSFSMTMKRDLLLSSFYHHLEKNADNLEREKVQFIKWATEKLPLHLQQMVTQLLTQAFNQYIQDDSQERKIPSKRIKK